jgi:hypothetical protein
VSGVALLGERVAYSRAGRAARQANARAVALGDELSRADWLVLVAVILATTSYSRLVDRVEQRQLVATSGVSARQVRRSLGRLAEGGVLIWVPGRGSGVLTVVGVPPEGTKADDYLSSLGLPASSAFQTPKADRNPGEKADSHARARKSTEKVLEEKEQERLVRERRVGPGPERSGSNSSVEEISQSQTDEPDEVERTDSSEQLDETELDFIASARFDDRRARYQR